MITPFVIGLVGKKGSGKDTVANYLVDKYGFEKMAFADALKEVLYKANPYVPVERLTGTAYEPLQHLVDTFGWDRTKNQFPEVRRLLQEFGVQMREVSYDVWVNALGQRLWQTDKPVVVSDVRFTNELNFIEDAWDGWTIRINRVLKDDVLTDHISETELDGFDARFTIENDKGLMELLDKIDGIIAQAEEDGWLSE